MAQANPTMEEVTSEQNEDHQELGLSILGSKSKRSKSKTSVQRTEVPDFEHALRA